MITTTRLTLRPWLKTDLEAMTAINANEAVMRYFPTTQNREETMAFIERQQVHQEKHGYCYFAAELRTTEQVIGFIGLNYQQYTAPFSPATDIGWRLHPDHWRKGLATEGAVACLAYAFDTLQLNEIVSVAIIQNLPSIGVMQKIGMELAGEFDHPALADRPDIQRCAWYRAIEQ